mmetsp:Transcript_20226/g.40328  ORF Transcript_20226/g.40328 Transcript_20226/m.40328 type:complete len:378 (-) Transcript_20226:243-1376(-)
MKSVLIAYILWLFGGVFGWHHAYLNRTTTAVAYFFSFGGLGVSFFLDIFCIPAYVREANAIHNIEYLQLISVYQKNNRAPALGFKSFAQQFTSGLSMSFLMSCLAPKGSPDVLIWTLEAVGTAFGVCYGTFGSVSKHTKTSLLKILVAAMLVKLVIVSSFLNLRISFESVEYSVVSLTCVFGCYITYCLTRDWDFRADDVIQELESGVPKKTKRGGNGFRRYCALILVMGSIFSTGLIQHGVINSVHKVTGEPVQYTVREAFIHIIRSPAFTEFSSTIKYLYGQVRSEGFAAGWELIKESLDPSGQKRAYKDLELTEGATKLEIKAAYRRLALKYHPDKVNALPEDEQVKAQENFFKIQEAYKILSELHKNKVHDEL